MPLKVLFTVTHPAKVHVFKHLIKQLESDGHHVKVLAINKENALDLLDAYNIDYRVIGQSTGSSFLSKIWIVITVFFKIFFINLRYRADVSIAGWDIMLAVSSTLLGTKHISFADTDTAKQYMWLCNYFSYKVITPSNFKVDLGKNQIRVSTYKELCYLHPNYFTPDSTVKTILGLRENEKMIILRFVAWNAYHDVGQHGISNEMKDKLVEELAKDYKVFISSEERLPERFEKYLLPTKPEQMHDVLYYSHMLIGESGTMSKEAAFLGTPVVAISTLMRKLGDMIELEDTYDLMYSFDSEHEGYRKIWELLERKNLKEEWSHKCDKLFSEKVDGTAWLKNFLYKYFLK